MKWLFLLGLSATASVITVAVSGIVAGKHALSGLDLFSRQPEALFLFGFLVLEWALLINDVAATRGLSKILGHSVEFRETRMYAGADSPGQLVSLRTKLYLVYPVMLIFFLVVLAIQISRL